MRTEAHKRASKKYYASPKGRASQLRYQWRNKDRVRIENAKSYAKRRALKHGVTIGDSTEIAKVYNRCRWWRQWFDVVVDHTIPFINGGTHEANNLQIIYAKENLKKHVKLDYKPQVIFV